MGFLLKRGSSDKRLVSEVKGFLIKLGYLLNDSGVNKGIFGPKMEAAVADFQENHGLQGTGEVDQKTYDLLKLAAEDESGTFVNPALEEARKYRGQKETDKSLQNKLIPFWKRVGLPGYKSLIGISFAWCALFFFAMNSDVGQDVIASAGAKRIGQSGYEIDWKKNGIPEGAGVWKNSSSCKSSSGNHITWSSGSCTAVYINSKGATWTGFGGNQGNAVKDSIYCAKGDCKSSKDVICRVFWHKKELPPPVKANKGCGGAGGGESTT